METNTKVGSKEDGIADTLNHSRAWNDSPSTKHQATSTSKKIGSSDNVPPADRAVLLSFPYFPSPHRLCIISFSFLSFSIWSRNREFGKKEPFVRRNKTPIKDRSPSLIRWFLSYTRERDEDVHVETCEWSKEEWFRSIL